MNQVTLMLAVPARILSFFFSTKPTYVLQKTFSRPILRFLANFEARYIQFEDLIWKSIHGAFL